VPAARARRRATVHATRGRAYADSLRDAVRGALAAAPPAIDVDLRELDRLDGPTVRALVWARRSCVRAGCEVRFVGVRAPVADELSGLRAGWVIDPADPREDDGTVIDLDVERVVDRVVARAAR
jgi:anti-anti-sigma regulatory factor